METSTELAKEIRKRKCEILRIISTAPPKVLEELFIQLAHAEVRYHEACLRELRARGELSFYTKASKPLS